jgi:hypothetical protein
LNINSEKRMKNEELITLRGGDGYSGYCCWCFDREMNPTTVMYATNGNECLQNCWDAGQWMGWWVC